MGVTRNRREMSVAVLLLCLLAAFAISPPDCVRSQQRSRASRTVRLDDHDLDHALDAESLSSDLSDRRPGAGPDIAAAALPQAPPGPAFAPFGLVVVPSFSIPAPQLLSSVQDRAPPAAL